MFGFKKENAKSKKFLNEADFQAENIPIHTMSRDLELFRQAGEQGGNDLPEDSPPPELILRSPAEQTGNSPFLPDENVPQLPTAPVPRPKIESFVRAVSTPLSEKEYAPTPEQEIIDVAEKPVPNNNERKKFMFIFIIILLIMLVSAGGYYFWSTRSASRTEKVTLPEVVNEKKVETPEKPESPATESPKFSNTERNYFMVDLGDASSASFRPMVQNYFNEISNSKISFPVEFTIIDTGNSPIDFKTFAAKVGIKFSPKLLSALNDDFSFYIYNDQGNQGVGLAMSVKEELDPEEKLLREEINLPMELGSIFPASQYVETRNGPFLTGEHDSIKWGKVGIRFRNLDAQGKLSVDYALINTGKDMLFIGTTKNTLRSMIDSVNSGVSGR